MFSDQDRLKSFDLSLVRSADAILDEGSLLSLRQNKPSQSFEIVHRGAVSTDSRRLLHGEKKQTLSLGNSSSASWRSPILDSAARE